MRKRNKFLSVLLIIFVLGIGICAGYFLPKIKISAKTNTSSQILKNKYLAFIFEVYDTIKDNYWENISDEQLTGIYLLGIEKLSGQPLANKPKNKEELLKTIDKVLKSISEENKKKEFIAQLSDIVLANLQPFGRSRLYSQKEETSLKNQVENKNPDIDQYKVLEVNKDASIKEIEKTYEEKTTQLTETLKKEIVPEKKAEAEQKLLQVQKAFQVLSDQESKKIYDESGVEPTMEYKLLRPDIFYIHLTKFSPTTVDELFRVTTKVDKGSTLNTLIFDLRDNIGGTIDGLPYFLGPFIGNDQYAYQFYHQGAKEDFKTKIGWLPSMVRYKKVVVMINKNTQSSAEVMASVIKKYNVGILIGETSRGWGTVEKVFELKQQIDPNEKYSAFLVHSVTLREDGQPIEGRGVEPLIKLSDKDWDKQLMNYYHYEPLVSAIGEIL